MTATNQWLVDNDCFGFCLQWSETVHTLYHLLPSLYVYCNYYIHLYLPYNMVAQATQKQEYDK